MLKVHMWPYIRTIIHFSIQQIRADSFDDSNIAIEPKPNQLFHALDNAKISSLEFYHNTLIVGTTVITGYEWKKNQLQKKSWEIRIPSSNQNCMDQQNDINCLCVVIDQLYAGCGDNNVYLINLENGHVERHFDGHTDYIHGIHAHNNQLYSASQDGSIRIWDKKQKRVSHVIEPYKDDKLARPNLGKWQGSVSRNNDWLLCGGGPRPGLYHLRSLHCSTIFPFPKKVHVTGFIDDYLYIAGDDKTFNEFNINGNINAQITTSASTIYSVATQFYPANLISIGGTSNNLDLCTSLNYKDTVLKLY